jgi:phosphatidate cytidylyltransferase
VLKRILIGAAILGVTVGCYVGDRAIGWPQGWLTAGLGGVLFFGALDELLRLSAAKTERRTLGLLAGALWLGLLAVAALQPGTLFERFGDLLTGASAVAGLIIVAQVRRGPGASAHRLAGSLWFQVPYIGGLACLVAMVLAGGLSDAVGIVLLAKASDIGAYFTGKKFGRHPLAPKVSPKKTIEGAVGGVLLAAALAPFLLTSLGGQPLPGGLPGTVLHGVIIAILAMLSDLTESLIKRSRTVKDSSDIFGEAGGMLDLVDSLLLVGPLALAYTVLLAS